MRLPAGFFFLMKGQLYELAGTLGGEMNGGSLVHHESGVLAPFSDVELLTQLKGDGYLGAPLTSDDSRAVGILTALDTKPIFEIFTDRASTELN
ncbi:MAG: hypothetical protein M2R45_03003 [Verrucomicrobia subdivision 3 bacterium]|nr:hypothetical protein [Limisphaerales bacterium]MCS1416511.1 hypothetical protein [Limisphaerales bacterium]